MEQLKQVKKQVILLIVFLVLLFVVIGVVKACSKNQKNVYSGYYIFCIDANETRVEYEKYKPKAADTDKLIDELLREMQKEPSDISMKKAIPDNVSVEEYVLEKNGELTLYLNAAYGNYTGVNEILRRAAIVKTLCQISDVAGVQFYVSGQPLTDSNMEAVGFMTSDTFIDNTGGETAYRQNATLNMYFADKQGSALVEVPVEITYDATIPLEQLAIEQLMKGPYSIDGVVKDSVLPTIPRGTKLNKVTVKENTCYVDFNDAFLDKPDDITADVAIYSVVNTLIELSNINKVQFSINGEQVLLYNDTIRFGEVFERNLDLVQ